MKKWQNFKILVLASNQKKLTILLSFFLCKIFAFFITIEFVENCEKNWIIFLRLKMNFFPFFVFDISLNKGLISRICVDHWNYCVNKNWQWHMSRAKKSLKMVKIPVDNRGIFVYARLSWLLASALTTKKIKKQDWDVFFIV